MFAKSIVLSDAFLDMPLTARCLYFTLGMMADDDGFVSSPKAIMRQCGASQDDMSILLQKRYVLGFDTGVIVIKHWRINNYLRNDRYQQTTYVEEKDTLALDQKGAYTEKDKVGIPSMGIPSIDKDRLGKKSIKKFEPPTLEDVKAYAKSRGNKVDAQKFYDYYTAGNWVDVKGNPVKNWKQKMITWESKQPAEKPNKFNDFNQRTYDYDELRELVIK